MTEEDAYTTAMRRRKMKPGWYPAPDREGVKAYWDGSGWRADSPPPKPAHVPPAPGWYPDPRMAGTQRYWNGVTWTGEPQPLPPGPPPPSSSSGADSVLIVLSYLAAIFLPLIGFILGIVLLARRDTGHGLAVTLISIAAGLTACALIAGGIGDGVEKSFKDLDQELEADADLARAGVITDQVRSTESGFEVEIGNDRGFLGAKPEKACRVMREEGHVPATVEIDRTGEVLQC